MIKLFPSIIMALLAGCALDQTTFPLVSTKTVDRYAADILNSIQEISFTDNREYCGLIGYGYDGRLMASPATRGGRDGCIMQNANSIFKVIASYHTHGGGTLEADTEAPSYHDILADVDQEINGYIATPGGRFWKITHADAIARLICGPGCMKTDPKHKECKAFRPKRTYTAKALFDREMNDTGDC